MAQGLRYGTEILTKNTPSLLGTHVGSNDQTIAHVMETWVVSDAKAMV